MAEHQFERDYLCAFADLQNSFFAEGVKPPFHLEFDFTYDINNPCSTGNMTIANVNNLDFNKSLGNQSVSLLAGYSGQTLGVIGHHQVVSRKTKQEGADALTQIQAQALPGIDRKQNINWYCPTGGNFLKNTVQLCEQFGIEVGYREESEVIAKKEYSSSGTFVQIMDDLCDKMNAKWLFTPQNAHQSPNRIVEIFNIDENGFCFPFGATSNLQISQESGLTKFPTADVKVVYDGNAPTVEYSGEMLLNPHVRVGTRLIITDEQGKNPPVDMFVSKVRHKGSFYGDFWHTSFSGRGV